MKYYNEYVARKVFQIGNHVTTTPEGEALFQYTKTPPSMGHRRGVRSS